MRLPPNAIEPESSSQKPAIIRSSVVLPQPEGPSSVKNSPSRISSETSRTAGTEPKDRLTRSMLTVVNGRARRSGDARRRRGVPLPLARFLDEFLDLLQGFLALFGPRLFFVVDQLDRVERRHAARKLRQVEVLARGAAEGRLQ